jgi:DNA (cytosine-5)-methyltransferase 1
MKSIRYGTFCSGIEGASAAWKPLGWECQFVAEIDQYCCALLKQHYPDVPNLGNMLEVDGKRWRDKLDVLIAGTPCQAFSVAGRRLSLADARGNLTLKFVELVHEIKPRIVVWENVPGVLSTHDNAFGCFLAGLVGADEAVIPERDTPRSKRWRSVKRAIHKRRNKETGEWEVLKWKDKRVCSWPSAGVVDGPLGSACWRVLDAQYFGLAQRRERVFLIFCPPGRIHPAQILLEFESLRRYYPPSREERQAVTGTLSARTQGGGGLGTDFDLGGVSRL